MIKDIISELSRENHLFLTRPSQGKEVSGCLASIAFFIGAKKQTDKKKKTLKTKSMFGRKREPKKICHLQAIDNLLFQSLCFQERMSSFLKVPHGNNHKIQLFVSFYFTLCQESWQSREIVTDIKLAGVNKQVVTTLQQILIN